MQKILIRQALAHFGDKVSTFCDVLIEGPIIKKVSGINSIDDAGCKIIEAKGLHLFPGIISDQVHFREPGYTYKGNIYTESRAAVAGGVTSFMEMPNTNPSTTTLELLEWKYNRASECSLANYSFYIGATNDNLDTIRCIAENHLHDVCGIKIFMGSSTGNLLVDNGESLEMIFSNSGEMIVATHCEDDTIIKKNLEEFKNTYKGENSTAEYHPFIRNVEACYKSSSLAVHLAQKHNTRLHVLHISTEKEIALFTKGPIEQKRITAEACIHHIVFNSGDYKTMGNFLKWNPAVKAWPHQMAIQKALTEGIIDVIDYDHAPHTLEEKKLPYLDAPSGGPLLQDGFNAMIAEVTKNWITYQQLAEKMSNNKALLYGIDRRGFIREGYYADLCLVDVNRPHTICKEGVISKCKWSPFEGKRFNSTILKTLVNGNIVYDQGRFNEEQKGVRLLFNK